MIGIDLKGKRAFVAGIGDDKGFGWAIALALAEAGAEVIAGTWPPVFNIFTMGLQQGKFDENRKLRDGGQLTFSDILPFDACFDTMDDVPADIRDNKRYKDHEGYSVRETAAKLRDKYGSIDILVHSLANAPEVQKPLLETSRQGYLAAISASSYSFISMMAHFGPLMSPGSAALCLSYLAAERVIAGYGGGMSSAKAALESDTRYLAAEAGRKWGIRVNCLSAGPYASRAAKAIGFIDKMIDYYKEQAPLPRELTGTDIGNSAAFLCSPLAAALTGVTLHVDHGYHTIAAPLVQ